MKYALACEITDNEAVISGKRHVLVRKSNGSQFFLDDFFLDVIKCLVSGEYWLERIKERYEVSSEYISRTIKILLIGEFVNEMPEADEQAFNELATGISQGKQMNDYVAGEEGVMPRPARIMHVNLVYAVASGATIVASDTCNCLSGNDVSFFSGDFNPAAPQNSIWNGEVNGVRLKTINLNGIIEHPDKTWDGYNENNYYNPIAGQAFREFLEEVKPDIVHFHSLQWLGANLIEEAVKYGVRTVLTMHDWWWICARQFLVSPEWTICSLYKIDHSCYCRSHDEFEKRDEYLMGVLKKVDRILVPSLTAKRSLEKKGLQGFDIRVLENGVDRPSGFSPEQPDGPVVFGYLGAMHTLKGYHTLRDAVLSIGGGDFLVRMYNFNYGDGLLRDFLLGAAVKKPLSEIIEGWKFLFFPQFSHDQLDNVLGKIDVIIVPSLMRESFSLVTREALIRRIPVIVSDSGGPEEVIKDGVNGFIFRAGDAVELASKMELFIKDRSLLEKMRNNIDPSSIRLLDEQVEDLKNIYRELATSGLQLREEAVRVI